ncbi:MAG: HAD-IA family hydrolase [Candidatus Marinimicrobia bacterium]|nr:HAD-IA family hydrolase [Candidatus Neomarinimicrobiota bacterium]
MIKAIIFDIDNTLMDFIRLKRMAVESAILGMIGAGFHIDKDKSIEDIMQIYEEDGWEDQLVFNKFIENELGHLDYKYLASGILGYRKARESALSPYPFVTSTLIQILKKGIKLAIVSDAPSREAWLRLVQLNLHNFFDVVITFNDTNERKPSPKPFLLALEKLDLQANETMMVGDWPERDIVGAKSVGIKTVYAKYGDINPTNNSNADYDINSIDEILPILDKENKNA